MDLPHRFWAKVNKTDTCWLWTAGLHKQGYGQFWDSARKGSALAHRLSYEAHTGKKLPRKVGLDHTCQTEACVRPDHLREATQKQNSENLKKSRKNNTSGARGVYWDKVLGKWRAVVCHGGKKFSAGTHSTVEEAEAAVVAKRNELYTHNDQDR